VILDINGTKATKGTHDRGKCSLVRFVPFLGKRPCLGYHAHPAPQRQSESPRTNSLNAL
jgi:hypothetical protein